MGIFYGAIPPDSAREATERATDRALALDPSLGDALIARGLTRFLLDWDFTGAAEDLRRGMARHPTTLAQAFYTYFPWATAQPEEATRVALHLVDVEPTTALGGPGRAVGSRLPVPPAPVRLHPGAGRDTTGARRVLRELRHEGGAARLGLVYAALGEQDSMYVTFEHAIDAREPEALWFLNALPALFPLRSEPRYQALLERMGLPESLR